MAKGKRKSREEKIQSIKVQIATLEERKAKTQTKINDLKAQIKTIEDGIQAEKLAEIAKVMEESGKTPEDIMAMLKK